MAQPPVTVFDFAIVGAGRMGARIVGQLALSGASVAMYDRTAFDRQKGLDIMKGDMKALEKRGLLEEQDMNTAIDRVTLVESVAQVTSAQVVVEAIFEDLNAKRELFQSLEAAATEGDTSAIFTSTSINFTASQIFDGIVGEGRRACGLRFLYPVFCIQLVEISALEVGLPDKLQDVFSIMSQFEFKPFYYQALSGSAWRRKLLKDEVNASEDAQKAKLGKRASTQGEHKSQSKPVTISDDCIVCFERRADCVFAPCGHKNMCRECSQKIFMAKVVGTTPCPTCRQPIDRILDSD